MKNEPLKLQAYQHIKNNIVNCVYAPDSIITEELIREEINASRTPIRDAISRLEQEGLVRILPKKGIMITGVTMKEINTLYESRNLLEPYVVLHYGNRISTDIYLHYYHLYNDYLDGKIKEYSYSQMDESLHKLFINASENFYFINLYSTIESQICRTRIISGKSSTQRLHDTSLEHLRIVESALKSNWEESAIAMEHHLKQSKNIIFGHILQNKQ